MPGLYIRGPVLRVHIATLEIIVLVTIIANGLFAGN